MATSQRRRGEGERRRTVLTGFRDDSGDAEDGVDVWRAYKPRVHVARPACELVQLLASNF